MSSETTQNLLFFYTSKTDHSQIDPKNADELKMCTGHWKQSIVLILYLFKELNIEWGKIDPQDNKWVANGQPFTLIANTKCIQR